MSMQGWFLIMATSMAMASASFLLRLSIDRAGGFSFAIHSVAALATQPSFLLGFILYTMAVGGWFKIIATEKLNVAYPLMITLTFVLVSLGTVMFFKEPFSLSKATGLALIIAGIVMVTR